MSTGETIAAAYGGAGWSPRTASMRQEIGSIWGNCGVSAEWTPLKAVLLHRPGPELAGLADPDAAQMLASLDADRARQQHEALAQAYGAAGRVLTLLSKDTVVASGSVAKVTDYDCVACGACITACTYDAIQFHDTPIGIKAIVNPILCKGDGLCSAKCPTNAIILKHFTDNAIVSQIEAAVTDEDIIEQMDAAVGDSN